jgi:peptide/nickel transport system substrate-binding protein
MIAGPIGVDPHRSSDFHTAAVLSNVYEGLTCVDAQLRVGPGLSASWENPTNTAWLFHLRPGVRFHDGRPAQAEDVVFSLRRAVTLPQTDVASYLVMVKSVRAVDHQTVEILTERPAATLLRKLAFVSIVPRDAPAEIRKPIGTGPYVAASWAPGKLVELRAFPGYWGKKPAEKTVWLLPVTSERERARRLETGDLDIAAGLTPATAAELKDKSCCRVQSHDSLLVWHLEMRVDRPPFSDPRVREAVNLGIDREALLRQVLAGEGRPSGQMVTNNDVGFADDLHPPAHDLRRARVLLAEAGYPHGFDVELEHREGQAGAAELKAQLAAIGIRLRPVPRPWNDLYPRMQNGQVIFQLGSVLAESGDASDVLDAMMHTRGTVAGYGDNNSSGYSNASLDELIERSAVVLDPLKRRELLQRCMRVLARDLPDIPLFVPFDLYGVRRNVDWQPRPDALVLAAEIHRRDSE